MRAELVERVANTLWRERPEHQSWLRPAAFMGLAEAVIDDLTGLLRAAIHEPTRFCRGIPGSCECESPWTS